MTPAESQLKDSQPTDSAPKLPKPELMYSAKGYQAQDAEIVDYRIWNLWTPKAGFSVRGPRPADLSPGKYSTALGAAYTFGRFSPLPYPELVGKALGVPCLNLGFAGVGPSFYNDPQHSSLIDAVNRSKFVTISFFSGRSQANSQFKTASYSQEQYVLGNGQVVPADFAYQKLLDNAERQTVEALVAETRKRYVEEFLQLLAKITVPKVLFWFSKRSPDYVESYDTLYQLFSNFPHLVNREMIEALRPHCDAYVEQVGAEGLPQLLVSRFTKEPVTITRNRDYVEGKIQLQDSELTHNNYYPSPEMHLAAARKLAVACRGFV